YALFQHSASLPDLITHLERLKYEYKSVNLSKGEQFIPEFIKLNPIGNVSVLVDGDTVVADFFVILMYLEDKYPHHYPLLPQDIHKRAINYQKCIEEKISSDPDVKLAWAQHYIKKGFVALERLLKDYAGRIATGDEADLFLAPQIHAAIKRFNVDVTRFPLLSKLNEAYNEIPAFQDAMLEKQPDTTLASAS
ncbi:glutathione s-transferase zeta class, partial [Quercus suber]